MDGITNLMDMSMGKLLEMVKGREAWHAAIHGITESDILNNNKHPKQQNFQDPELDQVLGLPLVRKTSTLRGWRVGELLV